MLGAMASFAFNGSGHDNSDLDSDIFEEAQPWYRSTGFLVIVGLVIVGLLVFAFRAWNESVVERKTDAFLTVYAQATDNATRLKVLEAHPAVPETVADLLMVGASFLEAGDRDNAAKAFALASNRFPHSELAAGTWLAQGQLLAAQGKTDEATAKLRKVISSPDRAALGYRPLALLTLARLHQDAGKTSEARQELQDLIAKYPESAFLPEARAQLGHLPAGS
jgi:predicted negative regulator of RcsB-dependent stress response